MENAAAPVQEVRMRDVVCDSDHTPLLGHHMSALFFWGLTGFQGAQFTQNDHVVAVNNRVSV